MKIKIIKTGEIKTVLNSVGRMLIEQGAGVYAEQENDPETDLIKAHLGTQQGKKTERVEVVHRHVIEEEE